MDPRLSKTYCFPRSQSISVNWCNVHRVKSFFCSAYTSIHACLAVLCLIHCIDRFQEFDLYKDYKKFMSTVFTLLGANATTVNEEVKRIVELESEFLLVGIFFNLTFNFQNIFLPNSTPLPTYTYAFCTNTL